LNFFPKNSNDTPLDLCLIYFKKCQKQSKEQIAVNKHAKLWNSYDQLKYDFEEIENIIEIFQEDIEQVKGECHDS
jgi:hypothetical protein